MSTVVYWMPLGACGVFAVLLWRMEAMSRGIAEQIAARKALDAAIAVKLEVMGERAHDFAEALLLWHHGAQQEAVELLTKWVPVKVNAAE